MISLAVTDPSGTVVEEYSYTAYGEAETAIATLDQPFRYTGREYDPDTGLYHYRARMYDPATGRFLQEDPLHFEAMHPDRAMLWDGEFPAPGKQQGLAMLYAGELNVYRYVGNNPANLVDPSGTSMVVSYLKSAKRGFSTLNNAISYAMRRATGSFPKNKAGRLINPANGRFVKKNANNFGVSVRANLVEGSAACVEAFDAGSKFLRSNPGGSMKTVIGIYNKSVTLTAKTLVAFCGLAGIFAAGEISE